MTGRFLIAAVVLWLAGPAAHAAGLQRLELPAGPGGPRLVGAIWSPCAQSDGRVRVRHRSIPGVLNCPVAGKGLPLVVISHGYSGWFAGHHDTAAALADGGFVVAAITHPNERDRRWRYARPAAIKRLIDHMLTAWSDRARIDPTRIGFFGFSRGGYTGLVAIGGVPDFRRIVRHCRKVSQEPFCRPVLSRRSRDRGVPVAPRQRYVHDPRIKAAVIAAPLGVVFGRRELKAITVPVQIWRAARDERVMFPHHADAVAKHLPRKPDYRVVQAGHFAFLAPCTPRQAAAVPALCHDRPGFDRRAFHKRFNQEVITFFRKNLR